MDLSVCMNVVRMDPVSMINCEATWCKKVYVKCKINPNDPTDPTKLCELNGVKNGDFTEAARGGLLGAGGQMGDWNLFPNRGDGTVFVDDSTGANEDGHLILQGDKNNFAGIWQAVDLQPDNFTNISFEYINYDVDSMTLGTKLEFRLQEAPDLGSSSQILLTENLDKSGLDESGWLGRDRSFRLRVNPDMKYLVICLQNDSADVRSILGLDNIEICTSPVSGTNNNPGQIALRLFPNPTTGELTIEWTGALTTEGTLEVVNVTGQSLRQMAISKGAERLTTDLTDLPDGIYFLKLLSAGQQSKVLKFVKSRN